MWCHTRLERNKLEGKVSSEDALRRVDEDVSIIKLIGLDTPSEDGTVDGTPGRIQFIDDLKAGKSSF